MVARLSGYRWIPFDPVLRDRARRAGARARPGCATSIATPRSTATRVAEVRGWFAENGVEYLRTYPSS